MKKLNLSILAIIVMIFIISYFFWVNIRKNPPVNNDAGPAVITPQDENYGVGGRA